MIGRIGGTLIATLTALSIVGGCSPRTPTTDTVALPPAPPAPPTTTVPAADASPHECPETFLGLEGRVGSSVWVMDPECDYPGVAVDELWQLAVSQALAGGKGILAGPTFYENSWREQLLGICADFDDAAAFAELDEQIERALDLATEVTLVRRDALAPYAYWLHPNARRDTDASFNSQLAMANQALRSGAARGWVYAAVTATSRYCPEYRQHLRQHRSETLILQETLRRCLQAEPLGHDCLRHGDLAEPPLG